MHPALAPACRSSIALAGRCTFDLTLCFCCPVDFLNREREREKERVRNGYRRVHVGWGLGFSLAFGFAYGAESENRSGGIHTYAHNKV